MATNHYWNLYHKNGLRPVLNAVSDVHNRLTDKQRQAMQSCGLYGKHCSKWTPEEHSLYQATLKKMK